MNCVICDSATRPLETPCKHCICQTCVNILTHDSGGQHACPICRQDIGEWLHQNTIAGPGDNEKKYFRIWLKIFNDGVYQDFYLICTTTVHKTWTAVNFENKKRDLSLVEIIDEWITYLEKYTSLDDYTTATVLDDDDIMEIVYDPINYSGDSDSIVAISANFNDCPRSYFVSIEKLQDWARIVEKKINPSENK
jgi:hypothetical protein